MEIEVLSASLILVASLCGGLSCVFIARNRGSINKHSRQRIKDFENDIKYLAESKKEEAQDYRKEILRLKSSINRIKDGPTVTDTDLKNSSLGDVISQLIPAKYRNVLSPINDKTFAEDPLRVYRAVQFCARFEFKNEAASLAINAAVS